MSNPMQSEREKLIEHIRELSKVPMRPHGELYSVSKVMAATLADYILQREQEARKDELHTFVAGGRTIYESSSYSIDGPALAERLAALTPKSTIKTLNLHKAGRGKPDGNHEAFTVVEEPKSTTCTRCGKQYEVDHTCSKSTEPKEGRPIRLPEVAMQAFDSDPKGQQFLDVCSDFRSYMFKQDAGDMWKLIYYSLCIPLIADFVVKRETSATPQDSTASKEQP